MATGSDDKPPDPPGTGDILHTIAKAAISIVPIGGGPAAELLDLLRLPIQKRQHAWLNEIAVRLKQLEREKRLTVDDVVRSDAFLSATVRALDAARRTTERDKVEALRNGVLNVALTPSLNESLTQLFLDWIDRFTVWHLMLLRAVDDPPAWTKKHNVPFAPGTTSPLADFLFTAFPELARRQDFFDLIWADLFQAGLVTIPVDSARFTSSDSGAWPSRTSDIGKEFLNFIAEPQP